MRLTLEQQRTVEENMGLVHKVIHDKVRPPYQVGIYAYDDLVQIGCIGLCKAVATDRGGRLSTYAYRLIWNELCDAMIQATRRQAKESASDLIPYTAADEAKDIAAFELSMDVERVLSSAQAEVPPSTAKGIAAMRLMAQGYLSREIGEQMNASDKLVCAWVSKARKFLKEHPQARQLAESYRMGA